VTRTCVIHDCDRKVNARGWCAAHYQRWAKYGDPLSGPPFRKPRGVPFPSCSVPGCDRDAGTRGWCDLHYRRWARDGHPGVAGTKTPGAGRHTYPNDTVLVDLMRVHGTFNGVAAAVGVARESLRDYLRIRPALLMTMREHLRPELSPEQAAANDRQCGREYARRFRAQNPEEARLRRREQMASYGPEYRQRWNHYNRLRRKGLAIPDRLANEYAVILRGDPCVYCGAPMEHIDHIAPIAGGGTGSWDNLTAACAACNFSKSDRPLLTFMLARVA
jgi:5-methylcytosine-specific restriction endonuclease McrA